MTINNDTQNIDDITTDDAADSGANVDLIEKLSALEKRTNDLSAQLGRANKTISALNQKLFKSVDSGNNDNTDAPPTKQTKSKNNDVQSLPDGYKELDKKLQRINAKEAKTINRMKKTAIQKLLVDNGAEPELAELAVSDILSRRKADIIHRENADGDYEFMTADGAGIETLVKGFLSTAKGKKILGTKSAPTAKISGRNSGGVTFVSATEYYKQPLELRQSGKVKIDPNSLNI